MLADNLRAGALPMPPAVRMKKEAAVTRLRLIGVPSSAGAHAPGVERGPARLRAAGLAGALAAAGVTASDAGDLPVSNFATTASPSGARNLPAVLEVVGLVADAVAAARADGDVAVLLGGDCTLVLGAVAGLREQEQASNGVGVFYLDGDADLDTPQEGWGVLDSCGVAHLLGDGDPQLAGLRPGEPLLNARSLVLFGFHPAQLSAGQWRRFASHGLYGVPVTSIPAGTAGRRARQALGRLRDKPALLCHLDVDVIDYARFPLADCPRYHGGLSLSDTFDAVTAAAGHPGLACLTLTEVNPDHDPTGELSQELVSRWTKAIAAGIAH
jgi:arginase